MSDVADDTIMSLSTIEYVLFDMDGLMIDSERVDTEITNNILAKYGKEMTWDIKAGLMGKFEREAGIHLLSFFPDIPLTLESYLTQRDSSKFVLWPKLQPLPGVRKLVQHLHLHKISIAVATGSRRRNFELKTSHLQDLFGCFDGRVVCGDDYEGKMRGKPNPDVFLMAAREALGRQVGEGETCTDLEMAERRKGLVFEDAIPGMQAGKRAGMSVIWVPDANLLNVEYHGTEQPDQTLKSIEDFVPEQWGLPPYA